MGKNFFLELLEYFPSAKRRFGSYLDRDGKSGRAVAFYCLDGDGRWYSEEEAKRRLLKAKVLKTRENKGTAK